MTHPWRVRVAATSSGWRGAEEHLSRACSRDPLPGQCLQDSRDLVRVPDAHVLCFMPTSKWRAVGIHLAGQTPAHLCSWTVPTKQETDQLAGASIRHFRKTALGTVPIGPERELSGPVVRCFTGWDEGALVGADFFLKDQQCSSASVPQPALFN